MIGREPGNPGFRAILVKSDPETRVPGLPGFPDGIGRPGNPGTRVSGQIWSKVTREPGYPGTREPGVPEKRIYTIANNVLLLSFDKSNHANQSKSSVIIGDNY